MNPLIKILLVAIAFSLSTVALAAGKGKAKSARPSAAGGKPVNSTQQNKKIDANASGDGYTEVSSTRIDFSDTAIEGKMKSPEGFMLQGHQSSSLSDMVKLRSNFRNQLNNSKSATKAIVK